MFTNISSQVIVEERSAYDIQIGNKWDIGIHLGLSNSGTDTHSWARHGESLFAKSEPAYGINLKYHLNPNFAFRLNYFGSNISGDDNDLSGPCSDINDNDLLNDCHHPRGWSMESPLHELSLDLEWEPRGAKRWGDWDEEEIKEGLLKGRYARRDGRLMRVDADGELRPMEKFKKILSPYFTIGVALAYTDPTIDYNGMDAVDAGTGISKLIERDKQEFKTPHLVIPYGVGLRYDLSERFFLDLEMRSILPTTDWLDGMYWATNSTDERNNNDSYQFGLLRLGIRLGGDPDTDGDGIKDRDDVCPLVPGVRELEGCPDSDGDGITDSRDNCPDVFGLRAFAGCPDSDSDGIIDNDDLCPEEKGLAKHGGCPDTDGDGIIDAKDKCPEEAGKIENQGCKEIDTDGDGVIDDLDGCPNVFGKVFGCPDTDGDGVEDRADRCPSIPGVIYGCPDTDGDGIMDSADRCPSVPGVAMNGGCPPEPEKKIVIVKPNVEAINTINFSMREIKFVTNSDAITKQSSVKIDEAVSFANGYPTTIFQISGYTDNLGDAGYNQRLSERRAKRVYDEMIKRGVDGSRLRYVGYGETNPIADNTNAVGRKENRRVEISVVNN